MAAAKQEGGKREERPLSAAEQRLKDNESRWLNDSLPAAVRVEAWLDNRGTPLEFETAVAFGQAGFVVEQGLHEKQSDGKPLEIDVLAAKLRHLREYTGVFGHEVVIECKYAPRPWVAFSPLNRVTNDAGTYAGAKPIETTTIEAARYLYRQSNFDLRHSAPSLWPEDRLAFGLTAPQQKENNKEPGHGDKAYEALVGTIARCRIRRERHEASVFHTTQMPLLVVGGELCMAEWEPSAKKVKVREIDSCIVEFRGDLVLPAVQVQVVTQKGLSTWLPAFSAHVEERHAALEKIVAAIEDALRVPSLKKLSIDASTPEGERIHDLLAEVLARREQAARLKNPRGFVVL